MSSMYPSYGGVPTKQCPRCGVSLAVNETRCANCGYYMAPVSAQGNGSAQQGVPWNGGAPTMSNQQNQTNNQQWQQFPVANGYAQSSAPSTGFNGQQQYMRQSNPSNYQFPAIPATPTGNGNYLGSHTPPVNTDRYYGVSSSQQPSSQAFSSSPTNNPQTGSINAAPFTASYLPKPRKRGPDMKIIIGTTALLVVLIIGGVIGYTLLKAPKQQASTGSGSTTTAPIPTPQGTPLFKDTFKDNAQQWNLLSEQGKFSAAIANNSLVLEDDNNQLLWVAVPGGKTFSDFNLYVDATLSKGEQNNGYGIYIRGAIGANNDFSTYYRFEFYGDGTFAVFKGGVDGAGNATSSRIVDYMQSPVIQKQGTVNHIEIAAKGSAMILFVNGKIVKTITDGSYAGGAVALFVSNLKGSRPVAQATFANFAIYPPQA